MRKEDYLSLLNELHKRTQEEQHYQLTIKKLELKIDMLQKIVNVCSVCVERYQRSVSQKAIPSLHEIKLELPKPQLLTNRSNDLKSELKKLESMITETLMEQENMETEYNFIKSQSKQAVASSMLKPQPPDRPTLSVFRALVLALK